MFRDDHEAALARIAALETDLARERSDDAAREGKLAELEAALAKERADLARAEAELARLRPPTPKPEPAAEPRKDHAPPAYLAPVVFFSVLAVLILIAVVTRCGKPADEDTPVPAPPRLARIPDEIAGFLDEGRRRGEAALPGSRMISFTATGVTEDGRLHPDYGQLDVELLAELPPPPEPAIDPSVPIGAAPPVERSSFDSTRCTTMRLRRGEWQEAELAGGMCILGDLHRNRSGLEPRCTTASIWARAKTDGAPAGAIATIGMMHGRWRFEIRDQRASFSQNYADDCE